MDTPISELGGAGVAVGAAMTGMRPIFEFQFSDFATLAMEQIVNQAAKMRFMLGGEVSVPLVMRFPAGSGTGAAAQHSQSLEAWLGHVPGLKVMQPATPHDAKGLLLAAIADPDPVMIFEHKLLYKMKGPVPEGHYTVPIGKAEIRREGSDLTIVATSIMVHKALEAAETLAAEGIDIEVVDLSTIRPMDKATIIESVKKTVASALRLRGGEDARHRRRGQRHDRRERGLRLSRRADRAAGRRRDADPLQSRAGEGDGAAGARHRRRGPRSGAREAMMPVEVILPKVDMDMATGQISRWFVAEGAAVKQGDLLFEIETDKAAMEIDAPAGGIVRDITGKEGVDIAVGSPVAWIYAAGEAYGGASKQNRGFRPSLAGQMSAQPISRRDAVPAASHPKTHAAPLPLPGISPHRAEIGSGAVRATPLARRLARENGIALSAVAGSGPHGRDRAGRCRGGGQGTPPLACRPCSRSRGEPLRRSHRCARRPSRCRTMRC